MSIAESPRFEATEALRQARRLRGGFDEALLKNPGFIKAAGESVLHPRPNNDTMGGQEYTFHWEGSDGARFVVRSSYSRWGETLQVSVSTRAIREGIAIGILGRNKDQGEFRYSKAHVSGAVIDACQDDPRTISKAEEILRKLAPV